MKLRWDGQQGRRINIYNYKDGDIIIISKTAKIKWCSKTKYYYIDKGYKFTKIGDFFEVKVEDLTPGSRADIVVKCDYCGKIYHQPYCVYYKGIKNGSKKSCSDCQNIKQRMVIKNKYGVDNISQLPETQKKIAQNNLMKYGVTNTSQLDTIKEKVIQTNRKKFGVDYPMQLSEFQERIKNTDLKKYGVEHHTKSPDVIAKRKRTNIDKYGFEYPIQNKDILSKSLNSRYQHGNFSCSSQQFKLFQLIGGELNYPFHNFVIDIAFPDEKLAIEWDGSGHDLSVRLGHITESEFNRNENFRNITLFKNDWKIIRFITHKDIFPDNILDIFNYCKNYINNGGHKIYVLIDEQKIHFKKQFIDFENIA